MEKPNRKHGHNQERFNQPVEDGVITTKSGSHGQDKDVSASSVEVKTVNGVVHLSGIAKSRREADKAVSIARGVTGVTSVRTMYQGSMVRLRGRVIVTRHGTRRRGRGDFPSLREKSITSRGVNQARLLPKCENGRPPVQ
jgi:hypothetical protein